MRRILRNLYTSRYRPAPTVPLSVRVREGRA